MLVNFSCSIDAQSQSGRIDIHLINFFDRVFDRMLRNLAQYIFLT